MTAPEELPRADRGESPLAFSIMLFFIAALCGSLGWAEGVRTSTKVFGVHEMPGWLTAAGILVVLGFVLLIWSRSTRRG